ncbi:MAG: hypothetical protein PHC51_10350 [bacterium]|nr:hypothetical protein [bacterium]
MNERLKALLITALCTAIIFLRHPGQFLHPQFWVEGSYIYLFSSTENLLINLYGYLCLVQKIIVLLLCPLTPAEFHPAVCVAATVLLLALTIYYFQRTPSRLPFFGLFALGLVLSPLYGSEVYAKMLYLMWTLPLAVFLLLFRDDQAIKYRTAIFDAFWIILAGLSGPIILVLLPALLYVTALKRSKYYFAMSAVALLCGAVQVVYLSYQPQSAVSETRSSAMLLDAFFTFFTNYPPQYMLPGWIADYQIGMLCFGVLLILVFSLDKTRRIEASVLGVVLMSTAIPPILKLFPNAEQLLNPVISGSSRYFFYPFLAITFFLLLVALKGKPWGRIAAVVILVISFANNLPGFQTSSFNGRWADHVRMARSKNCNARIPIPSAGVEGASWTLESDRENTAICSDQDISRWIGGEHGSVNGKMRFSTTSDNMIFASQRAVKVHDKSFVSFAAVVEFSKPTNIQMGINFFNKRNELIKSASSPLYHSILVTFSADIPKETAYLWPFFQLTSPGDVDVSKPSIVMF